MKLVIATLYKLSTTNASNCDKELIYTPTTTTRGTIQDFGRTF